MLPPFPKIPKAVLFPALGVTALLSVVIGALVLWRILAAFFPALEGPMKSAPRQPVAFSHARHAGELGIQCEFCHRNVTTGAAATVPAVQQCMFCHEVVRGSAVNASEIDKVRTAWAEGTPINWIRVHRVPDHVRFIHEPHIRVGVACATCHGPVDTMQQVRQVRSLKMGDCVNCHRQNNAPTDCVVCHY